MFVQQRQVLGVELQPDLVDHAVVEERVRGVWRLRERRSRQPRHNGGDNQHERNRPDPLH
jgi:hypothetical protein